MRRTLMISLPAVMYIVVEPVVELHIILVFTRGYETFLPFTVQMSGITISLLVNILV